MNRLVFEKSGGIKVIAWLSSLISVLDDKKYVVEVKQYRKKRSLDANAYCWKLIDELAAKLHKTLKQDKSEVKAQIYQNAIRDIGGVSVTSCMKTEALPVFTKAWTSHGMGWQVETFPSKIEGCINVTAYYGSSVYDTAQMSRLIDNIVQDCKAVGIETMTPQELELLKQEWK